MQDMVPELDDLRRKRIFSDDELKQIIKRRRDFEYLMKRMPNRVQDYLNYVQYEVALECLRRRRNRSLKWRKKTVSDYAGVNRVHSIFNRGLAKFKADVRLWYQHVDFCLRSGSTKLLTRVLLKAVKYHPREIHFWLLAADRHLKLGQIKAGRAMLLRGIRFTPRSAKLWSEILRLESQVAQRLYTVEQAKGGAPVVVGEPSGASIKDGEKAVDKPEDTKSATVEKETDIWAPARMIFRRGIARLDEEPEAGAIFLRESTLRVREIASSMPSDAQGISKVGFDTWHREVWEFLSERRPGLDTAPGAWKDASADVAVRLWELWWNHELSQGRGWRGIAKNVLADAPVAVISHCASTLADAARLNSGGAPLKALSKFTASPRVAGDDDASLVVLEALEPYVSSEELRQHALALLSAREQYLAALESPIAQPPNARIQLLASSSLEQKDVVAILKEASGLSSDEAVRLFTMAVDGCEKPYMTIGKPGDHVFETLVRRLASDASPLHLLKAYLTQSLSNGLSDFNKACDHVIAVSAKLWEMPQRRTELLAGIIHSQVRVLPTLPAYLSQLKDRFEELLGMLNDADPAKIDWWIDYIQFVQRAIHHGSGSNLPHPTSLHQRAMRSVANQALYTERSQKVLQML